MPVYCLPIIPYDLIAAVNRLAAATGSLRYGEQAHRADYNGHHVTVSYNGYRKYWVTEYFWAGRVVLARGEFHRCLEAAVREYERGAKGTKVSVSVGDDEFDFAALAVALGCLPEAEAKARDLEWQDPRFQEVASAVELERWVGVPAVALLLRATTVEEYRALLDAEVRARQQYDVARFQRG